MRSSSSARIIVKADAFKVHSCERAGDPMGLAEEKAKDSNKINFLVLETMEHLLSEFSLSEISVKHICAEAHISRSAFYQRFSDKYDIGRWHYNLLCSEHLDNIGVIGYRRANKAMLEGFSRYRSFYRRAFAEDGKHSLTQYALFKRKSRLKEIIFLEKGCSYDLVFSYQITAFNAAAVRMVIDWIKQDMPLPQSKMAELLNLTIPDRIRNCLEPSETTEDSCWKGHNEPVKQYC